MLTPAEVRTRALRLQQQLIEGGSKVVVAKHVDGIYQLACTYGTYGGNHFFCTPWGDGSFRGNLDSVLASPSSAYNFALDVIGGPWARAEALIAEDPDSAYLYARDCLCGRFPLAESSIALNPKLAFLYARDVIKGPWPQGEATIAAHGMSAFQYAKYCLRSPWPPGEPAIAINPNAAYWYSKDVLQGPFPAAAQAIAKSQCKAEDEARMAGIK